MPRIRRIQSSFSAGVLDPRLAARIDVQAYYNGAELMDNAVCLPHGGVSRRPGTKYIDDCHPVITRITSGITATAPEGGTASNANDGDDTTYLLTTGNIGTVNPYIVIHYDLGSAKLIHFAEARLMSLSTSANA